MSFPDVKSWAVDYCHEHPDADVARIHDAMLVAANKLLAHQIEATKITPTGPAEHDTPEYQAFVEDMAQHCECDSDKRPCDGVLAGGLCDGDTKDAVIREAE